MLAELEQSATILPHHVEVYHLALLSNPSVSISEYRSIGKLSYHLKSEIYCVYSEE